MSQSFHIAWLSNKGNARGVFHPPKFHLWTTPTPLISPQNLSSFRHFFSLPQPLNPFQHSGRNWGDNYSFVVSTKTSHPRSRDFKGVPEGVGSFSNEFLRLSCFCPQVFHVIINHRFHQSRPDKNAQLIIPSMEGVRPLNWLNKNEMF